MHELIKKLKSDPSFIEFTDYVMQKIEEMDNVSGLEEMTNARAGEEAKIRFKVKQRLYEILKPFIEFYEKNPPTEKEVKSAKEKFGL